MKNIKDLKEQYNNIVESESKEERKLTTLVRSGLFDAKKLPALKRAMDKPTEKMTPAEKKILIDLLDSLINQVVSSDQVYGKVKRNVQDMHEELKIDEPVTIKQVPSIVVFKRRAVRVYPGGRQVGLYYSYQLDKYITIPFGEAGLAMESVKPKPSKKPPTQDEIDDEIEKKKFDTLSPEERKRVTTGKVFTRSVRAGQKPSVIAAKTITAFLLNRRYKNAKTSSGTTETPKASAPVQTPKAKKPKAQTKAQKANAKAMKAPKIKLKSKAQAKAQASKTLKNNPKAEFMPAAKKHMGMTENFKSNLKTIRESNEQEQLNEVLPIIAAVGGLVARGVASAAARAVGGALARGAAGAAVRGAARKGLSKGSRWSRGLVKARKLARSAGNVAGALGSDSDNQGNKDNTSQEKPDRTIKHNRQSTLKVSVGGPEYKSNRTAVDTQDYVRNKKFTQSSIKESVELDGNQFVINKNMAEKIVGVYNSLNEENKKIMIAMLNDQNNQQKIFEFVTRY